MRTKKTLVNQKMRDYIRTMTEASQIVSRYLRQTGNSQRWLARESCLTETTIRNVIKGRSVASNTVVKLRSVRGLGNLRAEHFVNGSDT